MVKFIHKTTNTPMWVADKRKDEYLAAGHKLAAELYAKPVEEAEVESSKEEKKRSTKKK
jgi:hypothetical protein